MLALFALVALSLAQDGATLPVGVESWLTPEGAAQVVVGVLGLLGYQTGKQKWQEYRSPPEEPSPSTSDSVEKVLLELKEQHTEMLKALKALADPPDPETGTFRSAQERQRHEEIMKASERLEAVVSSLSTVLADLVGKITAKR